MRWLQFYLRLGGRFGYCYYFFLFGFSNRCDFLAQGLSWLWAAKPLNGFFSQKFLFFCLFSWTPSGSVYTSLGLPPSLRHLGHVFTESNSPVPLVWKVPSLRCLPLQIWHVFLGSSYALFKRELVCERIVACRNHIVALDSLGNKDHTPQGICVFYVSKFPAAQTR